MLCAGVPVMTHYAGRELKDRELLPKIRLAWEGYRHVYREWMEDR